MKNGQKRVHVVRDSDDEFDGEGSEPEQGLENEDENEDVDMEDERDEVNEYTKTEEEDEMTDGDGLEQDNSNVDGVKKKQKRRSKNDVQGRTYKCNFCDKSYLSYPAVYTHMKKKHSKGPDGQPLVAFNSGRGRGRPPKKSQGLSYRQQIEPTSKDFFRTHERNGGPTEPSKGFGEVYIEIFIKRKQRSPSKEGSKADGEETVPKNQGQEEDGADGDQEKIDREGEK